MDHSAKPDIFSNHIEWYSSKVKSVLSKSVESDIDNNEEERIIYSYNTAFHGMAAKLSQEEVKKLESEAGVVAIFPETKYELHTTRSPYFLGLEPIQNSNNNSFSEKLVNHDVVVGVLDTGVWPESESFNDAGMKPVPSHWKGVCETGRGFRNHHCNKKIVGARIFYHGYEAATGKIDEQADYKSPRDQDGHGTHTAATVAGSPVRGANLFGYAYGTARGMAPGTLDRRIVTGKIVICDRGISPRVQKGQVVKNAGGVGMILTNTAANGEELVADCHLLPAVAIGEREGKEIKQY
ncbi:hypothetical protein TSUD_45420, partial [Trifolium subterraneum]